ncbi:MAG: electron transfer flavoprotein, partial [Planctomycetes bacterium]|nr:electron transfer flavoprotein [Planctomycetota bacterium]
MSTEFVPLSHQPRLSVGEFICKDKPDDECVPMDVVFVGGGPAGLAGAIELARLVKQDNEAGGGIGEVEIAVLEKGEELGHHSLSGAVMNPRAIRELFPEMSDSDFPFRTRVDKESVYVMKPNSSMRIPTPPTMKNHGNFVVSLCEV